MDEIDRNLQRIRSSLLKRLRKPLPDSTTLEVGTEEVDITVWPQHRQMRGSNRSTATLRAAAPATAPATKQSSSVPRSTTPAPSIGSRADAGRMPPPPAPTETLLQRAWRRVRWLVGLR